MVNRQPKHRELLIADSYKRLSAQLGVNKMDDNRKKLEEQIALLEAEKIKAREEIEASRLAIKLREEELKKVRAEKNASFDIRISEKTGVISLYGHGKRPTSLYASQWRKVIEQIPDLVKFLEDNKGKYKESKY